MLWCDVVSALCPSYFSTCTKDWTGLVVVLIEKRSTHLFIYSVIEEGGAIVNLCYDMTIFHVCQRQVYSEYTG